MLLLFANNFSVTSLNMQLVLRRLKLKDTILHPFSLTRQAPQQFCTLAHTHSHTDNMHTVNVTKNNRFHVYQCKSMKITVNMHSSITWIGIGGSNVTYVKVTIYTLSWIIVYQIPVKQHLQFNDQQTTSGTVEASWGAYQEGLFGEGICSAGSFA